MFFSPVLGVREVAIAGNSRIPAEQLRQAAGVRAGTPLATVDLGEVERRVGAVRAVESARVERNWPGTLRVTVVERTPVAAVPQGATTAVVDRYGVVLQQVAVAPPGLPVLRVQRAGIDDLATRAALAVLRTLPPEVRDRVSEVRAPSPGNVTLRLSDGRAVVWGDSRHGPDKARVLLAVLAKPGHTYDVSSPQVVTVK
ncbi:FtsQ-type POTRA domain-containing protein [Microbispora sp. RL4-1S]|uniref:FtsQ-type POTRA domain-containing protein n=2 Tax=Microbispora oryzae TaxID=2806554 RepID=A0A941AHQ1_9ACTN|nr:FtsQ-type POTRA domain-containing protein [Microbispora oryzae]